MASSSEINAEIQVLRGYAVLITVIAHFGVLVLPASPTLDYYWLGGGVDLFFCISGFVIAKSIFTRDRSDFLLFYVPFLIRRIFRLWPAAIFWSLVTLFLSAVYNRYGSFDSFENNLHTAVAAWFQVVNFKIVSCLYYKIAECTAASPLRIYWSLSLEEQFYILFPIFLFFAGHRRVATLAALLALIQLFLYRPWPSPLWFFRTDAICLGIVIAWLHFSGHCERIAPTFLRFARVRIPLSLTLCALLFLVARIEIAWFFNGLVVLVAAALVFVASFNKGYFVGDGTISRIAINIGERSYSMYLTHLLCLVFIRELYVSNYGPLPRTGPWPAYLGFAAALSIALASEFSYRFIETPFRAKGRAFASTASRRLGTGGQQEAPSQVGR